MEYFTIHSCENCANLLLVTRKEDEIFPCPVCGAINCVDEDLLTGVLTLESPKTIVVNEDNNKNTVSLQEQSPEVHKSIEVLIQNGWKLKFHQNKD
jgi:DNA-directed RNA polymerase subunit M/transcription elongation factor TFIIS